MLGTFLVGLLLLERRGGGSQGRGPLLWRRGGRRGRGASLRHPKTWVEGSRFACRLCSSNPVPALPTPFTCLEGGSWTRL